MQNTTITILFLLFFFLLCKRRTPGALGELRIGRNGKSGLEVYLEHLGLEFGKHLSICLVIFELVSGLLNEIIIFNNLLIDGSTAVNLIMYF